MIHDPPRQPEVLTTRDMTDLMRLVKRVVPVDFDDGQELVIMVQRLSIVIQDRQQPPQMIAQVPDKKD